MDNFTHKAHKLKSHEKSKYPNSSRSSPRPSTRRTGRFFSCRSIRLGGKQAAAIDISVRWAIESMVSCRAWSGDTRLVPFAFSRHFILFPDISLRFRTLLGDVRNCPVARAVPSCLPLSRAVCLKKNRPAHRLGWTGRSRRERRSAVPNSHRASG